MATRAAQKRLTREYQSIQANPPPYIVARPSDSNILEWHYILTGPPDTPYHNGQYWGTLMFPTSYPFAPPAIRMHTPSGRFHPSTRLCLSISDFHPKSFNPAWEVSTILIGLLSFMTSDEMTTGSLSASDHERRWLALRSKWWNSTGGGTKSKHISPTTKGIGAVKAGDGGVKFRAEWPELDEANMTWMRENDIDLTTGQSTREDCSPEMRALRQGPHSGSVNLGRLGTLIREIGHSWLWRRKYIFAVVLMVTSVIIRRCLAS